MAFYHLHMWVGNVFSRVGLSVCLFLSVLAITFEHRKISFDIQIHLQVKFEYQGQGQGHMI